MLYNQILENNEIMSLCRQIWDNMEDGTHGYIQLENGNYLTIVPENDFGEDFLVLAEVEEIDDLGYPASIFIDVLYLDEMDL